MQQLFDGTFCSIFFSEKNSLMKLHWKAASEDLSDEELKEIGLFLLDKIKEYTPQRILADSRDFLYIITPEIQAWFAEEVILPGVDVSIRRHAELMSPDLFSQVSIEQLHREKQDLNYVTAYFEDENTALEWILQA